MRARDRWTPETVARHDALAAEDLSILGWEQTDVTIRGGEQFTWWRKSGREFPQHFAIWLERSGAVRLLNAS